MPYFSRMRGSTNGATRSASRLPSTMAQAETSVTPMMIGMSICWMAARWDKGGKDYILMNNSSRGVMKMSTEKIDQYEAITAQTDVTGLPYETIADLKGVEQLDKLDDTNAVILARADSGSLDLKTIALP